MASIVQSAVPSVAPNQELTTEADSGNVDAFSTANEIVASIDKIETLQHRDEAKDITPEELKRNAVSKAALKQQRDDGAAKHGNDLRVISAAAAAAIQANDPLGLQYADKAVSLAEATKDPQKIADALRTRAIGAYQAGDFAKAAADSKRVVEMFPKDDNARMIYESSKNRTQSNKAYATPAPGVWPAELPRPSAWQDPRVVVAGQRAADRQAAIKRLEDAMRFLQSGQAQEALEAANQAQRRDPTLADAYLQRGLAWSALNELAKALIEVTKAIGLWTIQGKEENLPAAYALRAQIDNGLKDYPAALSDADKALVYNPAFAPGYIQRAKAGEAIGKDVQRALDDYKRAAELDPKFRASYEDAVTRLSEGRMKVVGPESEKRDWIKPALVGATALFLLFLAAVWRFTRRAGPEAVIGFKAERKELDSQYDIVDQIGEGGMGAVFKGWDKILKRPVAIKKLRSELQGNPRERERFLKEAEMVASLHHPHIVDIYTIIRDKNDTFLVFEFVSGKTLHDLLNESPGRRLPAPRALEILKAIAEAVDHAHGRHVIHRDLKPSNVMLADGGWVKVMDFGIARMVIDSLLTTTNTIVGTPVYMAPEQAMGVVVKESDVFALAVTLYELLTGSLPFRGPNEMNDKMEGRFVAASVLVPGLGTSIDAVLTRALSARAEERYHACGDFYRAAAHALSGQVTPATGR